MDYSRISLSSPNGSTMRHSFRSRQYQSTGTRSSKAFDRILSKTNLNQTSLPSFLRVNPQKIRPLFEFSTNLFPPAPPVPEVIIKVRGRMLSKQDMLNLKNTGPLSANVVDACLSLCKAINSQILRVNECHDRVMITNAAFSEQTLNSNGRKTRSKINVMKYE